MLATTPFTKYSHVVERTERIPYYVEQAVRTAWYGRPGAAYLDMPDDVILGRVEEDDVQMAPTDRRRRRAARPADADVAAALAALQDAPSARS